MASTIAIAVVAIVVYWIYSNISGLLKNIAAAKRSGLPYIIVPVKVYNTAWLITHKLWVHLFAYLPGSWSKSWLPLVMPDWVWELEFTPFAEHGDVLLTVSPGAVNVWLANAEALHQVTARRDAFPKPLESYKILDVFGRNIITTEGAEWKQHRKITSPSFNEKNNTLVFAEACSQAQGMLRKWTVADDAANKTLEEVPTDTMRLTLHVISRTGFGVRLLWPGEKPDEKTSSRDATYSSNEPTGGHTMSFEHALDTLLGNLIWVLLTPGWVLKSLPFKQANEAYESYVNWRQYMNELFEQKVEEARGGDLSDEGGMDLMGTLVRSAYGDSKLNPGRKSSPGHAEKGEAKKIVLSDSDILGNAFVMIVAGHETTANSIHFSLMELAINPRAQRLVQKDVHSIFGDEDPKTWDYESNINALLGGMVGAVLNEQLRLMPPVIAIPKQVSNSQDQVIVLEGKKHVLPAGAYVALDTVGVHRNPKYWPNQPSKITDQPHDLSDFRPERWLVKSANISKQHVESSQESEEEEFEGYTGTDTSAQLFRPARGAYIPFSDGARSCLGRRLAQVKVMGVLATVFQKYSIELAVDEWATDAEVAKMTDKEKRAVYKKAQDKARKTIRGATTIITLKLHPGFIPVRVVKKGEERFLNVVD